MKKLLFITLLLISAISQAQMIHRIENDSIVESQGLQQPNIERFTYELGWRHETKPEIEDWHQYLGERYFDPAIDSVTWTVVEKQFDIDQLYSQKTAEWDRFIKDFRTEIVELFLEEIALGTLSDTVKQFIVQLKIRKAEIDTELKGFYDTGNVERLVNYSFNTPETAQMKAYLQSLKN